MKFKSIELAFKLLSPILALLVGIGVFAKVLSLGSDITSLADFQHNIIILLMTMLAILYTFTVVLLIGYFIIKKMKGNGSIEGSYINLTTECIKVSIATLPAIIIIPLIMSL